MTKLINRLFADHKQLYAHPNTHNVTHLPEVRRLEKEKGGVLILDDSIEEKPYTDENEIICWHYHNLKALGFKDGEKRIVWLKDLAFPVALITKIFKNEDGSTGILHLVTNDLDSDADRIYDVYQKRWRIEEYHKSIKQNASLEKSPTKVVRSQRNHIFASIIAYCKLEFLRLKTALNHFALKYRLILRANQMAFQELKKIREQFTPA